MNRRQPTTDSNFAFSPRSEMLLAMLLLGVLIILLVPLPSYLLDMLLALNIGGTILLLLVTLGVTRPLDISVFPSLLLLMTLYRLSLNVATTRLILLHGEAGKIVETFGFFVVGGNLIVGLVIFLILIIIQFIVITRGAGRVSEVAARFTLDALPGKQMAIDAELGSGAIDDKEARRRREGLAREAEFFGAMDGASKFVRGDAIAGLVVTAINLLGGMILGVSNGLSMADAVQRYCVLTVGDGLVSQIPALIIATAAGILVTKAGSHVSLGSEIAGQLLTNRRPLWIGAAILAVLMLTPGLPKLPFLGLSLGLVALARRIPSHPPTSPPDAEEGPQPRRAPEEDLLTGFLETDRATVEIGARLIPLVDSKRTKGLTERIRSLRRDMTVKHGLWVPPIRIRDNLQLDPDEYRILIGGRQVARDRLQPEMLLAIEPPSRHGAPPLQGQATKDPTFGLPARWITASQRQQAELTGHTVVDAASVLMTHMGEVLRRHAHELLSRDDLQQMINKLKESAPAVVDEMKPDVLRIGVLHQVMVQLLEEQCPVTDLARILESVLNHAAAVKEPGQLAECVRRDLGRTLCDRFRDASGKVRVLVLDPRLESALRDALRDRELSLPPQPFERLVHALSTQWQKSTAEGREVAVLTDAHLRRPLKKAIERALPDLAVLSYIEIPKDLQIEPAGMLKPEEIFGHLGEAGKGDAGSLADWNELAPV
jgi:flagellar biosynthesis protein FlhA